MDTTITITTINKPVFLESLCENIRKYQHRDVDIIIIGDQKTPDLKEYCQTVSEEYGTPIEYLDLIDQQRKLPQVLLDIFDYNTPDRTMLGGMLAYLRGAERIIAIDDDNYVTENDFIGWHEVVGKKEKGVNTIHSDTGWFNVCKMLDANTSFYPRGYPFGQRHKIEHTTNINKNARVVANQGMVLGDPDIDAVQRLVQPVNAIGMNHQYPPQFGLTKTWAPFNYQNTCIIRELIPCYFRPKSGLRNADIWTAYIFQRLAEHMGDVITWGQPLVKQIRNEHDLFEDLEVELQNNKETDYFCKTLKQVELTEKTYFDSLIELVDKVKIEYPMSKKFFEEYKEWITAVKQVM